MNKNELQGYGLREVVGMDGSAKIIASVVVGMMTGAGSEGSLTATWGRVVVPFSFDPLSFDSLPFVSGCIFNIKT